MKLVFWFCLSCAVSQQPPLKPNDGFYTPSVDPIKNGMYFTDGSIPTNLDFVSILVATETHTKTVNAVQTTMMKAKKTSKATSLPLVSKTTSATATSQQPTNTESTNNRISVNLQPNQRYVPINHSFQLSPSCLFVCLLISF